MKSLNSYILPLRFYELLGFSTRSLTHCGKYAYAIDLLAEEGTVVYPAKAGKVVYVKNDSCAGGKTREFSGMGNQVVLLHENGEYTRYEHLQFKSIPVELGELVSEIDVIGRVGMTGITGLPHLHFEAYDFPCADLSEGRTIQAMFQEKPLTAWLEEDCSVANLNCVISKPSPEPDY